MNKSAGILAHFISLPSEWGVGDLGPQAYHFAHQLKQMKMKYWQVLPIGETDDSGCPYATDSAFGISEFLFSPEQFVVDFQVDSNFFEHIKNEVQFELSNQKNLTKVNYLFVKKTKRLLLLKAFEYFKEIVETNKKIKSQYENFLKAESEWIYDYCLFRTFKDIYGYEWSRWKSYSEINNKNLSSSEEELFKYYLFTQYVVLNQLKALKENLNSQNIKLIGDLPIFVSYYSMDVWRNPEEFLIDQKTFQMEWETGAAPDAFSEQGQKWGTPFYNFTEQKKNNYSYWQKRINFLARYFDVVRIDHFRGFESTWISRVSDKDARNGYFAKGPGADLFNSIQISIELIAEDLGVITPEVEKLRDQFNYPGMRVLEFMLGDSQNPHKLKNYILNSIAYAGTHDCDTLKGWFDSLSHQEKRWVLEELELKEFSIQEFAVKLLNSASQLVIFQLQDLLQLGSEARFNYPGTVNDKNWSWRATQEQIKKLDVLLWKNLLEESLRY